MKLVFAEHAWEDYLFWPEDRTPIIFSRDATMRKLPPFFLAIE